MELLGFMPPTMMYLNRQVEKAIGKLVLKDYIDLLHFP